MPSIPTPPATSLSTPSPTERPYSPIPTMASLTSRPLYLIVATSISPPLGIGLRGQLPWPPLKADMSFFKRVTTRPPLPPPPPRDPDSTTTAVKIQNAVIMGRKTWDSIPPKFRPLRDRINVVVSRSKTAQDLVEHACSEEVLLVTPNIADALSALEKLQWDGKVEVGKTFVIGGSEIYRTTMEQEGLIAPGQPLRTIQTQVRRTDGGEIDCDTFFPAALDGQTRDRLLGTGSRRVTAEEVEGWVGEELPQRGKGKIVENDADDAGEDLGDWLEQGELQIRVVGEEIVKK